MGWGRTSVTVLGVVVGVGVVAGGIHYFLTRDPTPIAVDPALYDEYAGYYVFPNGYPVTIRRDRDRLVRSTPEHGPRQLFAETETQFFLKGNPARWIFHRDATGRVDYAISRWKKVDKRAEKRAALPVNPAGTNGLIAATTSGKAAEAGLAVLQEGGSAVDAAIATALCEVVHAGGAYVSFAGPMMMVYYDAASGKVYYLDAQYNAPLKETEPGSIPHRGGRTALVPGFMAGMQAAHDRFGKLPFKRLFEPAIALAEKGEAVNRVMEWWIDSKKSVLSRYPETMRIFTRADGKFLAQGDLFRQPELAETLRKVSELGASYMYGGGWGQKFIAVAQREGGKLTLEDMTRYQANWQEPLQTSYRDWRVFTPTGWGGAAVIESLNLLELANLKQYGVYWESPKSLFLLMEISVCQSLTRDLPEAQRVSKRNAAEIWEQMTNGTWRGLPAKKRKKQKSGTRGFALASASTARSVFASKHTDGLVVVDRWGNMAVLNHTINTALWGNTGLFVDGVSIPDSAAFQGKEMAKAGPGNRLQTGMCPLIVCREGKEKPKPYLGSAAIGGGLHAKTIQMLVNMLDFGMEPQASADAPAFIGWGAGVVERDCFSAEVLDGLKEFGLDVEIASDKYGNTARGYWVGAVINPATGRAKGGVSRGLEGGVVSLKDER